MKKNVCVLTERDIHLSKREKGHGLRADLDIALTEMNNIRFDFKVIIRKAFRNFEEEFYYVDDFICVPDKEVMIYHENFKGDQSKMVCTIR